MTAAAPSGVVTFLFTDIEGSTRRWEADADGMRTALVQTRDLDPGSKIWVLPELIAESNAPYTRY